MTLRARELRPLDSCKGQALPLDPRFCGPPASWCGALRRPCAKGLRPLDSRKGPARPLDPRHRKTPAPGRSSGKPPPPPAVPGLPADQPPAPRHGATATHNTPPPAVPGLPSRRPCRCRRAPCRSSGQTAALPLRLLCRPAVAGHEPAKARHCLRATYYPMGTPAPWDNCRCAEHHPRPPCHA